MQDRHSSMRLPSSAANAAFYNRTPISGGGGNTTNNISEIIAKSKRLMGLDETKCYLTDINGTKETSEDTTESTPYKEQKKSIVSSPAPSKTNKPKFCSECGEKLTESAKFCSNCGNKF